MRTCPHCGAELREHARFCPRCMAVLIDKRVIPTPKYLPVRWLSATAAVLVLALAVWSVWTFPQDDAPVTYPADVPVFTSTAPTVTVSALAAESTTSTEAGTTDDASAAPSGTTLTTLAESFGENPTDATTTHNTWRPTYDTTGRVPPFLITTTTRGSVTTARPTVTTTTTKKTTTTTTTTTTRPYWQDVTPGAFTEDGLPIEEVTWTYTPIISSSLSLSRCYDDYPDSYHSSISVSKTHSGVPLNQCIRVTGCTGTTSNGIYRVPAMIDGKIVAAVDFGDSFADKTAALTVKRIYLPPDTVAFYGGITNCTELEALYFTGPEAWFSSKIIPYHATTSWGGVTQYYLTIYGPHGFSPTHVWNLTPPLFMYACRGNVYDAESGIINEDQCEILYGGA